MKTLLKIFLITIVLTAFFHTSFATIVEKKLNYMAGNTNMVGYFYYNDASKVVMPAVIIVHEWWGLNEYPRMRARMFAEMGYVAFCADMYGEGKVLDNPVDAQAAAGELYKNPDLLKERFNAAYQSVIKFPMVYKSKVIAVGYCFGGSVALIAANMGVPVQAVVAFHAGLADFKATPEILNTKVLVLHGSADEFVTAKDVTNFKNEMNNIKATYTFKEYKGATHAFTNKASTEIGEKFKIPIAYNEAADKASWTDMVLFLEKYNLNK